MNTTRQISADLPDFWMMINGFSYQATDLQPFSLLQKCLRQKIKSAQRQPASPMLNPGNVVLAHGEHGGINYHCNALHRLEPPLS